MFVIILISLISGIISGMGMGGGTILIPLLTIFCDVDQICAQELNLLSFIPSSIVATIIHIKNKLISFRYLLLSIPAVLSSILTSLLAHSVSPDFLRVGFGVFLAVLGMINLAVLCLNKVYKKEEQK